MGLLSRFLGAVFLVLVGGLLLLDRALLHANQNQAVLDAESAALLTESYLQETRTLLDRVSEIRIESGTHGDTLIRNSRILRLMATQPAVRRVWTLDHTGAVQLDVAQGGMNGALPPELVARLEAIRPSESMAIIVTRVGPRHALITIARLLQDPAGNLTIGMVFDGEIFRTILARTRSDTRVGLNITSGTDTVALLGLPEASAKALTAAQRIIRLPTGGTWSVTATHALTTQALRVALWILGVMGIGFLALGLLREQRRALQATGRSIELERLYSDVKRANQAKSEFLANVSHELRTPLNAIVGFVELLREGFYGDLSPRQVPPVDRIAASATHLRHLVDQVLDIAKIAAGRLEIHAETIVLRPFVLNVASELESLVSEKNLTFSITVGSSLPRVRTDPTHLRQILINLIGNAVKYTLAGTISVRARLVDYGSNPSQRQKAGGIDVKRAGQSTHPPKAGTWIALQVVDTGYGIPAADLDRIFDEFEQVNAGPRGDSMQRGTGLGLAISRRLARLLGGDIAVESMLGQGSTFTVWLPVNPADLSRDPLPSLPNDGPVLSA